MADRRQELRPLLAAEALVRELVLDHHLRELDVEEDAGESIANLMQLRVRIERFEDDLEEAREPRERRRRERRHETDQERARPGVLVLRHRDEVLFGPCAGPASTDEC